MSRNAHVHVITTIEDILTELDLMKEADDIQIIDVER